MKKWIISIMSIVLVFSIILLCVFLPKKESNKNSSNKNQPKIETKIDKSNKKKNKEKLVIQTTKSENDINEDNNNDNNDNKKEVETINQIHEEPVYVAPVVEQPQPQEVQPEPISTSQPQPEPQLQPAVQQNNIWDDLGITEYEYYHSPMWSWARVDFKIEDYGTFEATRQACIDAGNNTENVFSYSCIDINSYSGDYLGQMLDVKY